MDSSGRVELPAAFEEAHIDNLAILIADMLERLMAHNDRIPLLPESLTRFHSRSAPSISVLDYLKRIVKFTNVEKSCLLITLHYIDQICARLPLFTLSSLTCHRFIIASITIASKGLCDVFCTNNLYARVGGISVNELNMLEREFLQAIDWRLMCTREVLQEYYVNLVRTHSTGQFIITGTISPGSVSPSSDSDTVNHHHHHHHHQQQHHVDSGGTSRPPSPAEMPPSAGQRSVRASWPYYYQQQHRPSVTSASAQDPVAIIVDSRNSTPDVSRRPTIEQNMAFAALQESLGRNMEEET